MNEVVLEICCFFGSRGEKYFHLRVGRVCLGCCVEKASEAYWGRVGGHMCQAFAILVL